MKKGYRLHAVTYKSGVVNFGVAIAAIFRRVAAGLHRAQNNHRALRQQCDLSHAKTLCRLVCCSLFTFFRSFPGLLLERHKKGRSGACVSPSPVCRRDGGKPIRRSMQRFVYRRFASGTAKNEIGPCVWIRESYDDEDYT